MPPKATPRPRAKRNTRASAAEEQAAAGQTADPAAGPSNPSGSQNAELADSGPPTVSHPLATPALLPTSSSAPGESSAGPSSAVGPNERKPPPLKFQPKGFTRRQKELREAQDRIEEERSRARLAAEDAAKLRTSRGGARGGRAGFRGGLGGLPNERAGVDQASGPLGGGSVFEDAARGKGKRGRGGASLSIGSDLYGGPSTKRESGGHEAASKALSPKSSKPAKVKQEDYQPSVPTPDSDRDEDGEARIDIEKININLISDEEGEPEQTALQDTKTNLKMDSKSPQPSGSSKAPGWVMHPIRLLRADHVERAVGVNTDASSKTSAELRRLAKEKAEAEGSLFVEEEQDPTAEAGKAVPKKAKTRPRDVEVMGDNRVWKGVYQEEDDAADGARIKAEPTDDDGAMLVDSRLPEGPADAAAPADADVARPDDEEPGDEPKKKLMGRTVSFSATNQVIEPSPAPPPGGEQSSGPPSPTPIPSVRPRSRKSPRSTQGKPVLQTQEDEDEWERYQDSLDDMKRELLGLLVPPKHRAVKPGSKTAESEDQGGDTTMADVATSTAEGQESLLSGAEGGTDWHPNKLYTLQLPPMVPKLQPAKDKKGKAKATAKENEDAEESSLTEVPATASAPTKPPAAKPEAKPSSSSKKANAPPPSAYNIAYTPRPPSPLSNASAANQSSTLDPVATSRSFETGFPVYEHASNAPSDAHFNYSASSNRSTSTTATRAGGGTGGGTGVTAAGTAAGSKGGHVLAERPSPPSKGYVGAMQLFESGKASMEWGGVGFEVRKERVGSALTMVLGVCVAGGNGGGKGDGRGEGEGGNGEGEDAKAKGKGKVKEDEGEGGTGKGKGKEKKVEKEEEDDEAAMEGVEGAAVADGGKGKETMPGSVWSVGQVEGVFLTLPDWGNVLG